MTDEINRPAHYTAGEIECIDAIKAALTPEEFRGYCKGNILKYVWRERHKGGDQSLRKADWYLGRMVGEATPDDDWYTWHGSPNPPVHPKTRVDVKFTDGYEGSGPAESFQWERGRGKFSVTRWRVAREDAEQPMKKAAGDWVDCHGAPPWLIGSAKVEVKFRSGSLMTGKVNEFRWTHLGDDSDIVSYREVA